MRRLVGDEILQPCASCGGISRSWVTEVLYYGRIERSVSTRCECGAAWEECGMDGFSGIYREALVARVGLARVHADPEVNRPLRARLLVVFRRYGMTIAEAVDAYARLTGDGVTGTPAETQLLADRLAAAGGTVTTAAGTPS
ncbi:hypothetical protein AB0J72_22665 [Dactylosporangium sp. NPDC049742]|uniref:hypothetical protein n=1 Tax=Dactylosporangium sp. NPDC049742 TaxID=3154737 RepID=UPI003432E77B